jgi:hypothetical protein
LVNIDGSSIQAFGPWFDMVTMIALSLPNGHNESLLSEGRERKTRGKYFLIYF